MKIPRRKDYPKKLIIKGEEWRIRWVKLCPDKDPTTLGMCDPNDRIIYIKTKQPPRETYYTYIHELHHALSDEYGIKLKHKHIDKLEYAVGDFFLENF